MLFVALTPLRNRHMKTLNRNLWRLFGEKSPFYFRSCQQIWQAERLFICAAKTRLIFLELLYSRICRKYNKFISGSKVWFKVIQRATYMLKLVKNIGLQSILQYFCDISWNCSDRDGVIIIPQKAWMLLMIWIYVHKVEETIPVFTNLSLNSFDDTLAALFWMLGRFTTTIHRIWLFLFVWNHRNEVGLDWKVWFVVSGKN